MMTVNELLVIIHAAYEETRRIDHEISACGEVIRALQSRRTESEKRMYDAQGVLLDIAKGWRYDKDADKMVPVEA